MGEYAKNTDVSASRSRAEIEDTLARYGAYGFAYATTGEQAMIAFRMKGRQAKVILPYPNYDAYKLTLTGQKRTAAAQKSAWEQAIRQMWRIMLLLTKAKLEAIYADPPISTFEWEFMADILLPNGQTVGESILPQIDQAYLTGQMPPLLPMPGAQ